ncbi:MAG: NAD(P)H-hydrate dehydratase [Terracidiphilus sp.]|nr:NAD(P)H-hydrate dehydratase [Terracidiphilus sp.]
MTTRSRAAFAQWFPRMSAVVVGPGLGRQSSVLDCAAVAIETAISLSIPLVVDADGLFLVCAFVSCFSCSRVTAVGLCVLASIYWRGRHMCCACRCVRGRAL